MINEINLRNLNMNHFTIKDAELYCQVSFINADKIEILWLNDNKLTDIGGVSIFKNLEILSISDNLINNVNHLKDLINLTELRMSRLNLTDEVKTLNILKSLPKFKYLKCINTFKTIDIHKQDIKFMIF